MAFWDDFLKEQERAKIAEATIQEVEKIIVQEEKKPKIILPIISPKRYHKIELEEEIEITSDNMRTASMLITGKPARNTIERIVYDLSKLFNDYKIVKKGRKIVFKKK